MNYRELLRELQKLSEVDLNKLIQVYDYETDTILEGATPSFEIARVEIENYGINYPFITIN
jgi:hypothetical protein